MIHWSGVTPPGWNPPKETIRQWEDRMKKHPITACGLFEIKKDDTALSFVPSILHINCTTCRIAYANWSTQLEYMAMWDEIDEVPISLKILRKPK